MELGDPGVLGGHQPLLQGEPTVSVASHNTSVFLFSWIPAGSRMGLALHLLQQALFLGHDAGQQGGEMGWGVPWPGSGGRHSCSHLIDWPRVIPPKNRSWWNCSLGTDPEVENGFAEQLGSLCSAQHHRVIEKHDQDTTPALKVPHILGGKAQTQSPGVPRLEKDLSPLSRRARTQVRITTSWNACLHLQLITEASWWRYRDPTLGHQHPQLNIGG